MAALEAHKRDSPNPLDRVERLAEAHHWTLRPHRATMKSSCWSTARWSDLPVAMNWRDELETLHVACSLRCQGARRPAATRRPGCWPMINEQLLHGHFDLWRQDGSLVFRNNLLLAGGAEANDAQCEALIRLAVETCQRYFPPCSSSSGPAAMPSEALESSLLRNHGRSMMHRTDRHTGAGGRRQDGRRHARRLAQGRRRPAQRSWPSIPPRRLR